VVGDKTYTFSNTYSFTTSEGTYDVFSNVASNNLTIAVRANTKSYWGGTPSWLAWAYSMHADEMMHSQIAFSVDCSACASGVQTYTKYVPNRKYTWNSFLPATIAFYDTFASKIDSSGETLLVSTMQWPEPGSKSIPIRVGSGGVYLGVPGNHQINPRLLTVFDDGRVIRASSSRRKYLLF